MRIAVLAAIVALAACGGSGKPAQPVSLQEWKANVAVVIRQLQADVATTQVAGGTPASAHAALHDQSDVYALLVAYTDLAGCHGMVLAAGTPTAATRRVDRLLASACSHTQRASDFFTRAIRSGSGPALLAGSQEARRALPSLIRAAAALEAVS